MSQHGGLIEGSLDRINCTCLEGRGRTVSEGELKLRLSVGQRGDGRQLEHRLQVNI